MIAKDAPLLETRDDVLDSRVSATMPPPRGVSGDSSVSKDRRDELGDAAIAAIREYATMRAA